MLFLFLQLGLRNLISVFLFFGCPDAVYGHYTGYHKRVQRLRTILQCKYFTLKSDKNRRSTAEFVHFIRVTWQLGLNILR